MAKKPPRKNAKDAPTKGARQDKSAFADTEPSGSAATAKPGTTATSAEGAAPRPDLQKAIDFIRDPSGDGSTEFSHSRPPEPANAVGPKESRPKRKRKGWKQVVKEMGALDTRPLTFGQKVTAMVSTIAQVLPGMPRPKVDMIARLREQDEKLIAAGWPPISDWWWSVLTVAYATGKPLNVVRGGRRGGKSTTMCRVAVCEATEGEHMIPPGDVGFFAIISAERDQAKDRLATCAAILKTLCVQHHATAEKIIIDDMSAYAHRKITDGQEFGKTGIQVFTASLAGVVGFTAIGVLCDELARWRDRETGTNPARAVLGTLKPSMLTIKDAKQWHVSAPWSTIDAHHDEMELGNTRGQNVFSGATWEMNTTISEQQTHDLEPDQQTWEREYKAIPMPSDETKFFSAAAISAAQQISAAYVATAEGVAKAERTVSGGDFAFRRDASSWVLLDKDSTNTLHVVSDDERIPLSGKPLVPSTTICEALISAQVAGADSMCCDLHYIETVREHIEDYDIELVEFPTSQDDIAKVYVLARVLLAQGRLGLAGASPRLIEQLKNTTATPTDGAGLSIKNKRTAGHHGDSVSALVCAVYASTRESPGKRISGGERRFGRPHGVIDDTTPKTTWHENAEDWKD